MKYKLTLCLVFFIFLGQISWSQTIEVQGKVIDETGESIIGANVTTMINSKKSGVTTDFDGNYKIKADPKGKLEFSYIGFPSQTISINGKSIINVTLKENAAILGEVIVMGYSSTKKSNIIGAVSSVKGEDLRNLGVTNISQAIQDRLPGVVATLPSGQPGADDAAITIRGASSFKGDNSPLILIDGIQATGGFSQLDPSEIASINVLKDASSTAVYGVRGANGVIIITTRRGSVSPPKINVSAGVTAKSYSGLPDQLGSYDVLMLGQEAAKNSNAYSALRPQRYINGFLDPNRDQIAYPDVDWYDALIKDIGWESNAKINVSGGTEFVKYFSSFSVNKIGDILKTEDFGNGYYNPSFTYDKYNFRTNLDFNLSKGTKFKIDISGRSDQTKAPNTDVGANDNGNLFKFIEEATPYLFPLYYTEDFVLSHPDPLSAYPGGIRLSGANAENPYNTSPYTAFNYSGMRKYKKDVVDVQLGLTQNLDAITKGLKFSGIYSYSSIFEYRKTESWNIPIWLYDPLAKQWRPQSGQSYNDSANPNFHTSNSEVFNSNTKNVYYELKLEYHRKFGRHDVELITDFNRSELTSAISEIPVFREDWVGIFTYNFDERYFLKGSAGYDGSEKFGPGKRFGFFPSAAVGWNIAKEKIVSENLPWLKTFKVRYSYGKSGNDKNAARFLYLGGYDVLDPKFSNHVFGLPASDPASIYAETKIANPNATWETAIKHNLGFDIDLFKGDFTSSLNLYKENRDGIFVGSPVPSYYHPSFGTGMGDGKIVLPEINQGKTKSHGLELEANYSHKIPIGIGYSLGGYVNVNDSRVVYRADKVLTPEYQTEAGKPIGWIKGYQSNGYINNFEQAINAPDISGGNNPGAYFYSDFNGDGKIDSQDSVPLDGTNQPSLIYAFNGGLSYKGFDVSIRFFGKEGVYYQANKQFPNFNTTLLEAKTAHLDRWSPENQNAAFPAFGISPTSQGYEVRSDKTLVNSSYLKLQSVNLGYNIKSSYLKKVLKIQDMRLNLSGQNLYTWSKLPYGDPEGGNGVAGGTGQYPLLKRFIFGVNIDF